MRPMAARLPVAGQAAKPPADEFSPIALLNGGRM
jgi:hypothetical protein